MGKPKRARRKKASRTSQARHSEDYLADIDAVTVRLDSGKTVAFNLEDELKIPSDPILLEHESRRASGRLAFWGYQAAIAKAAVKEAERQYDMAYANADLIQRHSLSDEGGEYTERVIKSLVEHTDFPDVKADALTKRKEFVQASKNYEVLSAIVKAVEHRAFTISALLRKRDND